MILCDTRLKWIIKKHEKLLFLISIASILQANWFMKTEMKSDDENAHDWDYVVFLFWSSFGPSHIIKGYWTRTWTITLLMNNAEWCG